MPLSPSKALPSAFCLASLLLAMPARANDSSAEMAAGGLVLTKSGSIAMESEDLTISPTAIDIAYIFRNTSADDETVTVAFPLPPIEGYGVTMEPVDLPEPSEKNFVGFTVEVDGKNVEPELDEHAFLGAWEVTATLRDHGLSLNPRADGIEAAIAALPKAAYAELEGAGLLTERDMGEALWRYEARFHFDQRFPAGQPVSVRHSYRPVAGSAFLTQSSFDEPDFARTYCIDAGTRKAMESVIRKAGAAAYKADPDGNAALKANPLGGTAFLRTVPYILTTANNWSGSIGRFHLIVEKGAPGNTVSLCQDGIRKTGPTRFEFTATDYRPKRDLDILFASPDATSFAAE